MSRWISYKKQHGRSLRDANSMTASRCKRCYLRLVHVRSTTWALTTALLHVGLYLLPQHTQLFPNTGPLHVLLPLPGTLLVLFALLPHSQSPGLSINSPSTERLLCPFDWKKPPPSPLSLIFISVLYFYLQRGNHNFQLVSSLIYLLLWFVFSKIFFALT